MALQRSLGDFHPLRGQQLQKFSSRERRAIGWDGHGHRLDTWGAGFTEAITWGAGFTEAITWGAGFTEAITWGRWVYRGDRLG